MNRDICRFIVAACLLSVLGIPTTPARAGEWPFIGEMIWVPYNFAPMGWEFCNGQTLSVYEYSALYAVIGNQYGGDGYSTFALPDMRGRLMIPAGQGAGLSNYVQGIPGGEFNHTLTWNEMPAHSHTLQATSSMASATSPASSLYAQSATEKRYGPGPTGAMSSNAIGAAGSGQSHNNMMPYGALNCIIAVDGEFPQRP